jgi:hypothetical protein
MEMGAREYVLYRNRKDRDEALEKKDGIDETLKVEMKKGKEVKRID